MPQELLQGGIGVLIIAFGVKYVLPILKSSLEASASRSGADATLHGLYQDMLGQQAKLSEENAKSLAAVVKLTAAVETLEQQLLASKEREDRLSLEVTHLRHEVATLTGALNAARGTKRATD